MYTNFTTPARETYSNHPNASPHLRSDPLKTSDFDYELPAGLIAQAPAEQRSGSRLLVVDPGRPGLTDARFFDLPRFLRRGDLLVFNDTRVIPARLLGRKTTGGQVEFLIDEISGPHRATARARSSKPLRAGGVVDLGDGGEARCLGREGELFELEFERPVREVLGRIGRMPLPPYIQREDSAEDQERYQTIFSRIEGAVAAPTAALHFDPPLMTALESRGLTAGYLTLHVGAGTFQPVRTEELCDHQMHSERVEIRQGLVERVRETKRNGGRVIAVGTTCVRALESAGRSGELEPFSGRTDLFIMPGFRFQVVDAMVTNFHLPRSTLLMLVSAFAGWECMRGAYDHAVAQRYRFFSYGDAMLIRGRAA